MTPLKVPRLFKIPRMIGWLFLAFVLIAVVTAVSPQQLPVVLYKFALIAVAVVAAYWLDRSLFPYARPDSYLVRDWRYGTDEPVGDADYAINPEYLGVFAAAMIRRALIVAAVVIGVCIGL